jgi:hypothetical protein
MSTPPSARPGAPGLRGPLLSLPVLGLGFVGAVLIEEGNRGVGSIGGQGFDVLWLAAWLGFPVVGAIILAKRGHHPVGWIMYAIGVCLALGLLANGIAIRHAFVEPVPVAGPLFTWLAFWVIVPAFGLPSLFLLLFPEGSAAGTWRRRLVRLAIGTLGLLTVAGALSPREPLDAHGLEGRHLINPLGIPQLEGPLEAAVSALAVAMAALTLLAILDAVRRMLRGGPVERQQLKWVSVAVVPFPVLMTAASLVAGGRYNDVLVAFAFFVSLQGLAGAVLIAITRYHLYEIDRIASRTASYAVVTGVLVAVYAGGVLLLGRLLSPITRQSEVAVAASTLLVAALFQPVRRRVQAAVDRRFNRARYDAQRAVEGFALRLRDEVDIDALSELLRDVAVETLEPAHVSLWVRDG